MNVIQMLFFALALSPLAAQETVQAPPNAVRLESLDLGKIKALEPPMGFPAQANRSVAGTPLTIKGVVYPHGVGTHSGSRMVVDLGGEAEKFVALAGVDDARTAMPKPLPGSFIPKGLERHPGMATVEVWLDGRKAFDSDTMRRGEAAKPISVDLRGARRMTLNITDGGRWPYNNPVDLAGAMIVMKAGAKAKPFAVAVPVDAVPQIASGTPARPAIHGPRVFGASPNRPFLFKIPATGDGPLQFAARNLPAGLTLDAQSGLITGSLKQAGKTVVTLEVKGPKGTATRDLTITGAERKLALTPPLGWNSWNVWAAAIDDGKVRQAADWMVKSGLAAHGFEYINIDDAWMAGRDANGEIQVNTKKFPDMKALADYVHGKGLKLGIYSSPGPKTCQQLEGSYQHEQQDARTYAKWGIDFLKYDLCSYGALLKDGGREAMIKPYRIMGEALLKSPGEIVYSLCQYGRDDVWEWAPEVGGQLWRTTGDIRDSWESMSKIGFDQNGLEKWAGPGHWNDPDMLVLGKVGWGVETHATRLTPDEQLTHFTLWSMLASPLLLGCDLAELDKFTLDMLTNDEVLEVNQDPLGKQASRRAQDGMLEVWAKQMSDGSMAVGLFNRGIERARITAKWSDVGLSGKQPVRDLWRHKDLGSFANSFAAEAPPHGVVLVKIGPSR